MTPGGIDPSLGFTGNRKAAFTLIELLVVIAIIGVLAGLIFPVLRIAKQKSQTTGCLSNLRQIAALISLYTADHNNYFMNAASGGSNYVPTLAAYLPVSAAASTTNIFVSPAAAHPVSPASAANDTCITYALNNTLFGNSPLKVNDVLRPSSLIMVANAAQIPAYNWNCTYTFWNPWQMGAGDGIYVTNLDAPIPVDPTTNVDAPAGMGYLRYVQNGNTAVNVAMVDGHAETIPIGKVLFRNIVCNP